MEASFPFANGRALSKQQSHGNGQGLTGSCALARMNDLAQPFQPKHRAKRWRPAFRYQRCDHKEMRARRDSDALER
jgi:hypothetical protein